MHLGVCYYPEQWPQHQWESDARRMAELGISRVRIAEFAWSRMEPEPGRYEWAWLDTAIETLAKHGLKVILGTPTATPPRWLVSLHPEILPVTKDGVKMNFGSRRHYDISSEVYREHCARIVTQMVRRYGKHPAVIAWQTDNELACHDTSPTYTEAARERFTRWLAKRYGEVAKLNTAWGNVFWSMEYSSFDEIGLPNLTPTDANPSHWLDFRRFMSSEVASFHGLQGELIREHAPGRDLLHNFMGFFTSFDHYEFARSGLDVAAWDSYPLPRTEVLWFDDAEKHRWARSGHPDIPAFNHDLYRGVGKGRMWVMEQQVGPVNWAPYNPVPKAGMARLWTWEAFAHGAELVSYFRWRQAPFAQEQMHSGINAPDDRLTAGGEEIARVAREMAAFAAPDYAANAATTTTKQAPVALLFDYPADWIVQIQRHGADFDYQRLVFEWYSCLREMGVDVDMLPASADLSGYKLVLAPSLPVVPDALVAQIKKGDAHWLFGPRTGSRTADFTIPATLAPGPLQAVLDVRVAQSESLRPSLRPGISFEGVQGQGRSWRDYIEPGAGVEVLAAFDDGVPALVGAGTVRMVSACFDPALLKAVLQRSLRDAGIATQTLPEGVRLRRLGSVCFAFNYGDSTWQVPAPDGAQFVLGSRELGPVDVAAWVEQR
ncbi:beta-galactosidase [Paraburkholderia sp. DHOC27]|uniref:beta-galactosidase n=1 Tax=Paraburkholderia sp. DHOC27 TaxID=2303330 RepID=UPI000E3BD0B9|nr:beta-galactosidase [Paraburkholderia sp. DHOC27]RFU45175.1 beta-galactosidase [Paraburkholderia sp. DHOC27]